MHSLVAILLLAAALLVTAGVVGPAMRRLRDGGARFDRQLEERAEVLE